MYLDLSEMKKLKNRLFEHLEDRDIGVSLEAARYLIIASEGIIINR